MHYLQYSSIKKPKQSVTTPYVTYISHKITKSDDTQLCYHFILTVLFFNLLSLRS